MPSFSTVLFFLLTSNLCLSVFGPQPRISMTNILHQCGEVYTPGPTYAQIDGASFGPTFPPLFFMTYGDEVRESSFVWGVLAGRMCFPLLRIKNLIAVVDLSDLYAQKIGDGLKVTRAHVMLSLILTREGA